MDRDVMKARKLSGIAHFERTHKEWKTPGTREAGQHANLWRLMNDILDAIRAGRTQFGTIKL